MTEFDITYALDQDFNAVDFLVGNKIADLLNEKLQISDYSATAKNMLIVFQCFNPENKAMQTKELVKFKQKESILELYLKIDFQLAKNASKDSILSLLKQTLLSDLANLSTNDFDLDKFRADCEPILG